MSATEIPATADEPVIRLVPTAEERLLRESVGAIAARYGAQYMRDCFEAGEPPTAMWTSWPKVASAGPTSPRSSVVEAWG